MTVFRRVRLLVIDPFAFAFVFALLVVVVVLEGGGIGREGSRENVEVRNPIERASVVVVVVVAADDDPCAEEEASVGSLVGQNRGAVTVLARRAPEGG